MRIENANFGLVVLVRCKNRHRVDKGARVNSNQCSDPRINLPLLIILAPTSEIPEYTNASLLVLIFVGMTTFWNPLTASETNDGNWRIVNYWSEWCAPCRVEIPIFNELSVRLAKSNVMVVGVNFDEDPMELTLEIAGEMGIEFTVLSQEEVDLLALKLPDVLPTTYLLSPSNKVVAKLIGQQSEQDILDALRLQGLTPLTD